MRISLTLSDRDLEFFRDAVQSARNAVQHADDEEVIDAIRQVITDIRDSGPLPDFIERRLPSLDNLIDMLGDDDWALPYRERERLLATFVYFCDPEDLIPDDIPGIGYLDDVIMIELLIAEMRHVSEAYNDFRAYRDRLRSEHDDDAHQVKRNLARRRTQLHQRMRRRLDADRKAGRQTSLW